MLSFSKTYELPLARTYVQHWGLLEAVREILQNALDSDSPFEYELDDEVLRVHSRNATLSPSTLLLGQSTKTGRPEKIGSFGEGYKIALLVLAREERPCRLRNGDRVWTPSFKPSRQFNAEVLCIKDSSAPRGNRGLTFELEGLTPSETAAIRDSCLQMQRDIGEVMETRYGRVLRGRAGRLYVGGLFVCETQLEFGYDMKPEFLRLERDRQTVGTFQLQNTTKEMWFDTARYEEIAELLKKGSKDVAMAEYGAPEMVKEACYNLFQKDHPGGVVAKDQEELEKLVEAGMTKTIYVGGAYGTMIQEAPSYSTSSRIHIKTPLDVLEAWFEEHEEGMTQQARKEFNNVLKTAKNWRNK